MLSINDKEVKKLKESLGYEGCKNCSNQIAPLRMCDWAEHGGDGYDTVFDIHQIIVCMAKAAPEALIAAIYANTELLTEITEDADDDILHHYSCIIEDIEKERKKLDDAN